MKNPFAPFFPEAKPLINEPAPAPKFAPEPAAPAVPAYLKIHTFIDKAVTTLEARQRVLEAEIQERTNELYHTNLTLDGLNNAVATIFDNAAEDAIIADLSEGIEEKSAAEIAAMFASKVDPDLCIDEGCEHHGTDHVCVNRVAEVEYEHNPNELKEMQAEADYAGRTVAKVEAKATSLLREATAAPSDTTPKFKTWYIGEIIDARTYNALPPKYRPTVGPWTDTPRGGTATVTAVSPKFKPDSFA